jgi:hypothetical protein
MTEHGAGRTRRAAKSEEVGGNGGSPARATRHATKAAPAEMTATMAEVSAAPEGWEEDLGVTPFDVIQGLLTEARGEGKDSTASTRVSAWEKLGKLLGMFDEKPDDISPRVLLG